jgi:hypothetical protein
MQRLKLQKVKGQKTTESLTKDRGDRKKKGEPESSP